MKRGAGARRGPRTHAWLLGAACVVAACNRPPARLDLVEATEPAAAIESVDVGEVDRTREPPLPVKAALDLVPTGALGVAHVPNYRAAMIGLGRDRFVGQHPDRYAELASEMSDELGIDLFDPDQLPRVGIDADGPVGAALLDVHSEAFMVYFRLLDRSAFERWLGLRLGGEPMEVSEVGPARVVRLPHNDELAFVLRPDFGAFVFVDRPQRAPRDFVAQVAEGDARRSVHHDPRFASLLAELPEPAHFVGFLDPPAILEAVARERDDRVPPSMPPPPAGATQADLDAWEAQRRDMDRFAREDRERRDRERAALDRTVGEVSALGGSVQLGTSVLEMRGIAVLPERSPWRELWVPGDAPAVLGALGAKPLLILGGRVRPEAAVRMMDRVAAIDGAGPEQVRREFASEFGIGLDELAGALRGDLGLAITQAAPPKKADRKQLEASYGLVGMAGLVDPGAASRLLSVFASHAKSGLKHDAKADAYVVDLDGGRTGYLAIIGEHAVIASDSNVLRQLRTGGPVPLDRHLGDPRIADLRALLGRPGVLAGYLDALLPVLEDLYLPYPVAPLDPISTHPQLSAEELARVPKSSKYRKKFRTYEKTLAALKKAQAKRADLELRRAVDIGKAVGRMAYNARAAEPGYVLDATWRLGVEDVAALVDAVASDGDPSSGHGERERELEERRWQLEAELRELRAREIEAYVAGKGAD